MAVDAHQLLLRLTDFQKALGRHRHATTERFARMDRDFQRLRGTYRGKAADEFVAHWRRTHQMFQDYEANTTALIRFLEERVADLRRAEETAF